MSHAHGTHSRNHAHAHCFPSCSAAGVRPHPGDTQGMASPATAVTGARHSAWGVRSPHVRGFPGGSRGVSSEVSGRGSAHASPAQEAPAALRAAPSSPTALALPGSWGHKGSRTRPAGVSLELPEARKWFSLQITCNSLTFTVPELSSESVWRNIQASAPRSRRLWPTPFFPALIYCKTEFVTNTPL